MHTYFEQAQDFLQRDVPFVSVTIVHASGSIPATAGAKMLVTSEGIACGTVGGGRVEKRALDEARTLLQDCSPSRRTRLFTWSLSKDIGMTCGGTVSVYLEAFGANPWTVAVFGAGHVAGALVRTLVRLDCRVLCIDPREEWLEKLPESPNLNRVRTDDMAAEVPKLPDGAFLALMTMGHATDLPILREALCARRFPFIGVIGSRAKAITLRKDLAEAGFSEQDQNAFHCPLGLPLGSNLPEEIAISVTAQLLQERDRL